MIADDDVATSQPFVLSARFAIENRLRETESTARERVEKEKKVGRILRRFWILGYVLASRICPCGDGVCAPRGRMGGADELRDAV
jgi:hypothetical protein